MKLIKYFNNELVEFKNNLKKDKEYQEIIPIFKIKQLEYKCKNEEFEYWFNIIKKTYGKYGEVTSEYIPDPKTKEEIRAFTMNNLIIDNKKKDMVIANMAKQINNLNIKFSKIEGDK